MLERKLIDGDEAARLLGISKANLHTRVYRGQIPHAAIVQVGSQVLYDRHKVLEIAQADSTTKPPKLVALKRMKGKPMQATRTYKSANGLKFGIDIRAATEVPDGADYWGYKILVTEDDSRLKRLFQAVVLQSHIDTEDGADAFVLTAPLSELKRRLDEYDGESTPMYWPDLSPGWALL